MKIKLCYFNQHWNIYIYSADRDSWMDDYSLTTLRENGGEYRLRKYNHPELPVYSFGFMADELKHRHGHGGEWSSNSMQINKLFNTNLLEIGLDQISVAVPVDYLKRLMGDNVTWDTHDSYGHWITHVKGISNPEYCQWTEINYFTINSMP